MISALPARRAALLVSATVLVLFAPHGASAATFPGESDWTPLEVDGAPITDVCT